MRSDRTMLCAVHQQIVELSLFGSPAEVDLCSCVMLDSSSHGRTQSHFYECINNPEYPIWQQLKFSKAYKYLIEATDLVYVRSVALQGNGEDAKEKGRHTGTKSAKLKKRVSGDVSECGTDNVARCL